MKGSGKILSIIVGLTCLTLVYVHLQVSSVIVSFDLHRTTNSVAEKQELLRRLQFNVDQLKAPRFLEEKAKKHDLALALPNKVEVVEVPPVPEFTFHVEQAAGSKVTIGSSFSKFFGRFIQTAQATTDASS